MPKSRSKNKLLWRSVAPAGELRPPAYAGDAGFDLVVTETTELLPVGLGGSVTRVPCGIQVALPPGTWATPMTRSSAVARGLLVLPTVIDAGYRGDLFCFVLNFAHEPVLVQAGDCLAQLLPLPALAEQLELLQVKDLPASERGERGFGSSGR